MSSFNQFSLFNIKNVERIDTHSLKGWLHNFSTLSSTQLNLIKLHDINFFFKVVLGMCFKRKHEKKKSNHRRRISNMTFVVMNSVLKKSGITLDWLLHLQSIFKQRDAMSTHYLYSLGQVWASCLHSNNFPPKLNTDLLIKLHAHRWNFWTRLFYTAHY